MKSIDSSALDDGLPSKKLSTRSKRRVGLVAVAISALLLVSCSTPADDSDGTSASSQPSAAGTSAATETAPEPLERDATAVSSAWERADTVISQPVISDGIALVTVEFDESLQLLAVDAQTGEEAWRQDIHPGIGALGIALRPQITETASGTFAAVFLRHAAPPADDRGYFWWTAPVAVDIQTGEELYSGEPALVTSRPGPCDDGQDLCFSSVNASSESVAHHVDIETGETLIGTDVVPLGGQFRAVSSGGLYSVFEDETEVLTRVVDGDIQWTTEVEALFGEGATTNLGWNISYYEDEDVFVGSVGYNPTDETDLDRLFEIGFSQPLSDEQMIGMSASTGEVLWTAAGGDNFCSASMGLTSDARDEGSLPVRCDFTEGTVEYPGATYENVQGMVVGYDILTGEPQWETPVVPVPEAESLLVSSLNNGKTFLFGGAEGLELVRTDTGESRAATDDDVFLCTTPAEYQLPVGSPYDDEDRGTGGSLAFPCNKDSEPVEALTNGALQDIGTVDGDMVLLSTEGKLSGYQL